MSKHEKLTVSEVSRQADVGRGLVRLDKGLMKKLGVRPGDVVELFGYKSTGAIVLNGYPEDKRLNTIRVDCYMRRNAGTSIGEKVTLMKAKINEAESISLAPTNPLRFTEPAEAIKRHLLGRPVVKGDFIIPVPFVLEEPIYVNARSKTTKSLRSDFFSEKVSKASRLDSFMVTNTSPPGIVLATDLTKVALSPAAVPAIYDIVATFKPNNLKDVNRKLEKTGIKITSSEIIIGHTEIAKLLPDEIEIEKLKQMENLEPEEIVNLFLKDTIKKQLEKVFSGKVVKIDLRLKDTCDTPR